MFIVFSFDNLFTLIGLNLEDLVPRMYKFFGPGSEYDQEVVDKYVMKSGE